MIETLAAYSPAFAVMLLFMSASAFFSLCEAAFFSLSHDDRRQLADGGRVAKLAAKLGDHSEQLLNSILLGNLVVNLLTFTLSAIITFQLQEKGHTELAGLVAFVSVFGVIFFCEILPKDIGVLTPKFSATILAIPISFVVRTLQPLLPILKTVNILSRRLFWPDFKPEENLRVGDLERAVEMSREDATLLKREQRVLQNVVSLSDIRAEELMRPRTLVKVFKPPVTLDKIAEELNGKLPRSGFLLVSENDSDEIATAVCLKRLPEKELQTVWESNSQPIFCVPWSISVAEVFDLLRKNDREIAAVLNEFGETIGVLTVDDIIETLFTREQGRSRRLLNRMELQRLDGNRWRVHNLTGLRRLQRKFDVQLPKHDSVTVGGLLREILERFPKQGDVCRFGPLTFHVVSVADADDPEIELTVAETTSNEKEPGV